MIPVTSFPKGKIKILLLGGIHASARETLEQNGYNAVILLPGELSEKELLKAIPSVHILGIRSATEVTAKVLEQAEKLLAIGCFCIGTNQVDLKAAKLKGIPVFNAPFSNTRSVAELVIAEVVMLLRDIPRKNAALHAGEWRKSARGAFEVRGKTLGIVGYGHIGTQVALLAEAMGMRVLYHDIEAKLSLGNAAPVSSLKELLERSDVITLHVPGGKTTEKIIGAAEMKHMKKGACLINASRGKVIDITALAEMLSTEHIGGAALDVYPSEPTGNDKTFTSPLCAFQNAILTPHIAGSTAEAQENIGREVTRKLISYSDTGSTAGAVNFMDVTLPSHKGRHRILHIHRNQPGVMAALNEVFARAQVNISGQFLQSDADVGYVVTDVDQERGTELLDEVRAVPGTIRSRLIY